MIKERLIPNSVNTLSSLLKSVCSSMSRVKDISLTENSLLKTFSINASNLKGIKGAYLKHRELKDMFLRQLWVFCLPLAVLWALFHTSHNPGCFYLVANTGMIAFLLVIAICVQTFHMLFP